MLKNLNRLKGNIKGTWRFINNVLQDVSCSAVQSTIMEIKSCGNVITNPMDIASKFNDYFVNVGPDLANKISPGALSASIKDTMPAPNPI